MNLNCSKLVRLLILLLTTLPASHCNLKSNARSEKKLDLKQNISTQIRVKVENPMIGKISDILSYTGTIEAIKEIRITPEATGKVKKIYVSEGDRVKKGQLLMTLDTSFSALQKNQARAAVAMAEVQVRNLEKEINRLKPLLQSGAISQGEYDKLKAQYEAAVAGLQQAKAAEMLSSHQIKVAKIRSPIDGIVVRKNINEGEVTSPAVMGQFGIMTVMNLSTVKVSIGVGEKEIPLIKKSMLADVRVKAYPDEVFSGIIEKVSPAADPISKLFPVEIHISNPEMKLKAGMVATVDIKIKEKHDALTVPASAIVEDKTGQYIFIVDKDNRARKMKIEVGIKSQGRVEVVSNKLQPSMKVVTEGNFGLRNGARVKIIQMSHFKE